MLKAFFSSFTTDENRKGWALVAALGCCVVQTAIETATMWLVRNNPMLIFWIGMTAPAINLIVVTGLMVLLGVKRNTTVEAKDMKVSISDTGGNGNA